MKPWVIYALKDPVTAEVRYIGWTCNPRKRLSSHLGPTKEASRTHKACWIKSLTILGLRPVMEILESGTDPRGGGIAEKYWVSHFRQLGVRLTNSTDGGDGMNGYKPTPEYRAKMSALRRGKKTRPCPEETKRRISLAQKGKKLSPEHIKRMSASLKGKPFKMSPEALQRRSAIVSKARLGKPLPPETRAKLSKSLAGRPLEPERKAKIVAALHGRPVSQETRQTMREKALQSWAEHRDSRLSAARKANLGRKASEETCAKLRASWASNHDQRADAIRRAIKGRPVSEETREKLRKTGKLAADSYWASRKAGLIVKPQETAGQTPKKGS